VGAVTAICWRRAFMECFRRHLIAVAEFGAKRLIFFFEAALLNGVRTRTIILSRLSGFSMKSNAPSLVRGRRCRWWVTGDHDDAGGCGMVWMRLRASSPSIQEPDVEKNDVKTTVRSALQGALGRSGIRDVTFVGEDGRKGFADAGFVVNIRMCGWEALRQSKLR